MHHYTDASTNCIAINFAYCFSDGCPHIGTHTCTNSKPFRCSNGNAQFFAQCVTNCYTNCGTNCYTYFYTDGIT
jgi:hypothetical protein